jgi:hypothetical protein
MELSDRRWQRSLTDWRRKIRCVTSESRNLMARQEQIGRAKRRFGLPAATPVFSCDKAGRDETIQRAAYPLIFQRMGRLNI